MIERRPYLDIFSHVILLIGVAIVAFPLYVTFIASTQTAQEVAQAPMSLLPGGHFFENYTAVLFGHGSNSAPVARMMWVSTVMALVIAIGKISISMLSARSAEHTSELQSLMRISYAVFCLKKKKQDRHI